MLPFQWIKDQDNVRKIAGLPGNPSHHLSILQQVNKWCKKAFIYGFCWYRDGLDSIGNTILVIVQSSSATKDSRSAWKKKSFIDF